MTCKVTSKVEDSKNQLKSVVSQVEPKESLNPIPAGFISHTTYGIAVDNMTSGLLKEITAVKEAGVITQVPLGEITYEDIHSAYKRVVNRLEKIHTDNLSKIANIEQRMLEATFDEANRPKAENAISIIKAANLELVEMMRPDNHRLLEDTTRMLKSLGINVSLAKLEVSLMSEEDYKEFSKEYEEENDAEQNSKERIYSQDSASINPKDTVGTVIKLYLQTQVEKRYDKDGNIVQVRDHKGFPKKINVSRTIAELYSVLSDISTYEGMIEKLKVIGTENANLASIASDLETKALEDPEAEYATFANTFFTVFNTSYTEGKKIIKDLQIVNKEDNPEAEMWGSEFGTGEQSQEIAKISVISSNTSAGEEGLFNEWKSAFNLILIKNKEKEERDFLLKSGAQVALDLLNAVSLSENTSKGFEKVKDILHSRFINVMKIAGIEMSHEGMNALKESFDFRARRKAKMDGKEYVEAPAEYLAYLKNTVKFTVDDFLHKGKNFINSSNQSDNQVAKIKDLASAQRSIGTDATVASYINDNLKTYFAIGNSDYVKTVVASIKNGSSRVVNKIAESTRLFKNLSNVDNLGKPLAEINRFDTDGSAGDFKEYSDLSQAYTTRLNMAFNPLFKDKKVSTEKEKYTIRAKAFNNVGYYFVPTLSDRSHADLLKSSSLLSRDSRGEITSPFDTSGNLKEIFSREFTNISLAEANEANEVRMLHTLMSKWEKATDEHFNEVIAIYEESDLGTWVAELKESKDSKLADKIKSTFVKNYHVNKKGGLGNAGWLQIVPQLNTLLEFDETTGAIANLEILSSPKALEVITSFVKEQYNYFEEELIDGGFLGKSAKGNLFLTSDLGATLIQSPQSKNMVDSLQSMFINDLLNSYEYMINFQGGVQYNTAADFQSYYDSYKTDPATAKLDLQDMIIDSNKRMSLLTSPQSKGRISTDENPGGMKATFKVAICKDVYIQSAFMDMYKAVLANNADVYSIDKLNMTDAQGLCTPERFKDILGGRGAFSYEKYDLYDRLMDPGYEVTVEDLAIVHSHLKGSYYGLHTHPSGRKMMMNLKYSVMPLFPALIAHSKELTEIAKVMRDQKIDEVTFSSAVKVGAYNVNDLVDENGNINQELMSIELDSNFYGEPVTESAEAKSEAGLGSQINKLINGNMEIYKGALFNVNGVTYAAEDMASMYNDVVSSLLAVGYETFKGDINTKEKLYKTLIDASQNNKYSNDSSTLLDQLSYDKETNELEIPFDFPLLNHRIAQQLFTVAKGKVLKLKMPGTAAILATSLGQYSLQEQKESERLKFVRLVDSTGKELTAEETKKFNDNKNRLVKAIRAEENNAESTYSTTDVLAPSLISMDDIQNLSVEELNSLAADFNLSNPFKNDTNNVKFKEWLTTDKFDRVEKRYPKEIKVDIYSFPTSKLQEIIEVFSKEIPGEYIADGRDFKSLLLQEYGMSDSQYKFAKANEVLLDNLSKLSLDANFDVVAQTLLDENVRVRDKGQLSLFEGKEEFIDSKELESKKKALVEAINSGKVTISQENIIDVVENTKLDSLRQELAELSQEYTVAPAECVASGSYFTKRFKEIAKDLTKQFLSERKGIITALEEEAKYTSIYESLVEQFLFKDGSYNMEALEAAGLLDTIAYRIPTQSKSSAVPGKIVRILPEHNGAAIIFPAELTAQSGADFDYDKVFVEMRPFNIVMYEDGKIKMKAIHPFGKSKASLTSKLFNMQRSILTSSMFFEELITPNSTKMFTDALKDIKALSKEAVERNLSLFSIVTQENHRIKNRDSAILIGAFANASMLHMIAQQVDISFPKGFSIDSTVYKDLGNVYTNSNELISEVVSQALSAAVDNAKDPILGNLNINTLTAPLVNASLLLGVDLNYVTELINSPAITTFLKGVSTLINKGVSQDVAIQRSLNAIDAEIIQADANGNSILVPNNSIKLNYRGDSTNEDFIIASFGKLFNAGKSLSTFYGSINLDAKKPVSNVAGNVRKIIRLSKYMPNLVKERFPMLVTAEKSDLSVNEEQLSNHTNGGFIKTGLLDVVERIGKETGDLSFAHQRTYSMLDHTLGFKASEADFIKASKVLATTAHYGLANSYLSGLLNFSNINHILFNEDTNFSNDLISIKNALNNLAAKKGIKSVLARALTVSENVLNSPNFGALTAKRITIPVAFLKSLESGEKADIQREMLELYETYPSLVEGLVMSGMAVEGFDRYAGSLKDIIPLKVYADLGIIEEHKQLAKQYEDAGNVTLPLKAVSNYILNNMDKFRNRLQTIKAENLIDTLKVFKTRFEDYKSVPVVFNVSYKNGESVLHKLQLDSNGELTAVETQSRGLGFLNDFTLDGDMFSISKMSEVLPIVSESVEDMNDGCII